MSNESVSNKEKGSKESLYSDVFVFHPTARPFHRKNLSELKQNISIIHVGIAHVKINCLLEEMRGETLAKVFWTREEVFPTFSELLFQFIGELKTWRWRFAKGKAYKRGIIKGTKLDRGNFAWKKDSLTSLVAFAFNSWNSNC
jgi:hypothetical protein